MKTTLRVRLTLTRITWQISGALCWLIGGRCSSCAHLRRMHRLQGLCITCVNLESVGITGQPCA